MCVTAVCWQSTVCTSSQVHIQQFRGTRLIASNEPCWECSHRENLAPIIDVCTGSQYKVHFLHRVTVKNSESHGSRSDWVNFNSLQYEQSICAKHFCPWKQSSTLLPSKLWPYPNEPGNRQFYMDASAIIVQGSVFSFVLSSAAGAEGWIVCDISS